MSNTSIPVLPCMCASFRRVSRALTQRYDAALRPLGLSITQFTILQALSLTQQASQGQLSEILSMDSTTLTRTLAIMHTHGWIDKREGTDHRQRLLGLTPAGKSEFNRALPHWRKAQAQLRTKLGKKLWDSLTSQVNTLTAAVAE